MNEEYDVGKENAKIGKDFLEKNAKNLDVITLSSGLQYKIIQAGEGASPKATDRVMVNYEGKLIDGEIFDSTYQKGEPISFGVNQVIKGWQEALQLMQPGSIWMLYIPADLAYGKSGSFGAIGPNETLIFKVDLISIES